ncbi:MAG TPA: flagellar hook assembly protein FlgD [bacterium]|nr:flagellar hook assembly protein FlgD [bacterium]
MAVGTIQSTTSGSDAQIFSQANILGKDDFLKLLVAQLANQDPLEPMKDQEFVAQLAQFSSLEQLKNLDKSLASLLNLQESSINALSVGLIGKTARVYASTVDTSLMEGPVTFELYPPSGTRVHLKIFDANGYVVREQMLESEAGQVVFEWDGTDAEGNVLADGQYTVKAYSSDTGTAEPIQYPIFVVGTVRSVDFSSGTALVNVNGVVVDLSRVIEVRNGPESTMVETGGAESRLALNPTSWMMRRK